MNNRQQIFFGGYSAVLHSMLVPIFTFVFALLYNPFGIVGLLQMEHASYSFNLTIIFCIFFGVVALSRLGLFFLRERVAASGMNCALWCVGEEVVGSLFASLYITLMLGGEAGYFEVVGAVFGRLFGIALYPYALLWFGLALYAERHKEEVDSSSLIKFHDEYHKLRFVVAPDAVVFLKSEENYVQIHYMENSKPKKFILRSSMRALEEQVTNHGLVRCHRSFYINPDHIKMIRKEPSGLVVALLKEEGYEPIPISRKYQDEITRLL